MQKILQDFSIPAVFAGFITFLIGISVSAILVIQAAQALGASSEQITSWFWALGLGIGFLGAGVIMRQEGNIHGLNTAATLWCSAAVGAAAGADLIIEAILATAFILSANTLLRPIVHIIDRRPLDDDTEVLHVIYIICDRSQSKVVMDELNLTLKHHNYPAKDIDVTPFGEKEVEIEVTLIATSIEAEEAQHIINHLNAMPQIRQAFWDKNTIN
ncbi:MgtC/SapB family protein [Acinetobacter baumannii]|nr:MgtC/SapB family protein [Acinetobacter baumannii]